MRGDLTVEDLEDLELEGSASSSDGGATDDLFAVGQVWAEATEEHRFYPHPRFVMMLLERVRRSEWTIVVLTSVVENDPAGTVRTCDLASWRRIDETYAHDLDSLMNLWRRIA